MRSQAVALRAGLALNIALGVTLLATWLQQAWRGAFWQADFSAFYTGWSMVLDGQGSRLYDLDLQAEYQHRLLPERARHGGVLPFNHPPHGALPFAAFVALLPWPAAFYGWTVLQVGLVVLFLRQLIRLAGCEGERVGRETQAQLVAALLGFPGLFVTFQMGQVSLLVAVALAGFALALLDGRPLPLAAWLVLGTIKPQLVLVPAVILLAGRQFRALGYAAALFAAWAGLATWLLGPAIWLEFGRAVQRTAEQTGGLAVFPQMMFNVKGLLFGLLGADHSRLINTLSLAALALVLVATFLSWVGAERGGQPELRRRLALSLQLGLLANPHLNPADTVAYAVPAALARACLPRAGLWRGLVGAGLMACPLILLVDLYGWPGPDGGVRPFFVAMLLLAAVLILAPPPGKAASATVVPPAPS